MCSQSAAVASHSASDVARSHTALAHVSVLGVVCKRAWLARLAGLVSGTLAGLQLSLPPALAHVIICSKDIQMPCNEILVQAHRAESAFGLCCTFMLCRQDVGPVGGEGHW